MLSRGSPRSTEGSAVANAYKDLATPKERVDFLAYVTQILKDRADSVAQQAVASAQGVAEQYAWAQRQSPAVDLDEIARGKLTLPRWTTLLSGASTPPARIVESVENGNVDRMVRAFGLTALDVLPGASEPSTGGRRRGGRKTRKGKSRRTRRR